MFPTPDPTYQAFQQRILDNGFQLMQPILGYMVISMVVALIILGVVAWLIYRNRDAIKKFFRE